MLNKLFFIFTLLFLVASCNKTKSTEKKMDGEWTIYKMKVTKSNGLSYYYEPTGTFNFSGFNDGEGEYAINMSYITPNGTLSKIESGTIVLTQEGGYFIFYRTNADGSVSELPEGRILLITKNDIEMVYQDNSENYTFVLEK